MRPVSSTKTPLHPLPIHVKTILKHKYTHPSALLFNKVTDKAPNLLCKKYQGPQSVLNLLPHDSVRKSLSVFGLFAGVLILVFVITAIIRQTTMYFLFKHRKLIQRKRSVYKLNLISPVLNFHTIHFQTQRSQAAAEVPFSVQFSAKFAFTHKG